jgi:imidazolonepropionase-like amidohydrolase
MRTQPKLSVLLSLAALFLAITHVSRALAAPANASKDEGGTSSIAVAGGTVLAGRELRPLDHGLVLVTDDRIVYIGRQDGARIPTDAVRVDAKGQFVLPGLIDAHVHVNDGVGLTPVHQFLQSGVTSVRDLGNFTAKIREVILQIESGHLKGPRIFYSGESFAHQRTFSPFQQPFDDPAAAQAAVRQRIADGASVIKIVSDITPELATAIAAETHRAGLPVAADVLGNLAMDAWTAMGSGVDTFEHMSSFPQAVRTPAAPVPPVPGGALYGWLFADAERMTTLARDLAARHAIVVPTLVVLEAMATPNGMAAKVLGRPESRAPEAAAFFEEYARQADALVPAMAVHYSFACRYLPTLLAAGVTIAAGTDVPTAGLDVGASLHRELHLLRACGMEPREVVRAATVNASLALRKTDIGALEPGARGDMIVVRGNPLVDPDILAHPSVVVSRGRVVDLSALQTIRPSAGELGRR